MPPETPVFSFKPIQCAFTKLISHLPDVSCVGYFQNEKFHYQVLEFFKFQYFEINWYVHDSKELPTEKFTLGYTTRYAKRPPIAESRILQYCQREDFGPDQWCVTFAVKPHDEPEIITTVRVEDFISLLISHILPPNFRQIRYYGALANRAKKELLPMVFVALSQEQQIIKLENWRERQIALTGIDPLACPVCHQPMKLVEIVYFSRELNMLRHYQPP